MIDSLNQLPLGTKMQRLFTYPKTKIFSSQAFFSTSLTVASSRATSYAPDEKSDFLASFLQANKVPQSTINHFNSIPWTRKILQDEAYETVPFFSRYFNPVTGENALFGQLVNNTSSIPHLLSRCLKTWNNTADHSTPRDHDQSEVLCLLTFGRGLDSHPSIVHGGFQCVIFDEVIRFLILLHHHHHVHGQQKVGTVVGPRDAHLTVNLETRYHAPMTSPATVLVRARLARRQGRKWWSEAVIEDCEGNALTSASSMWVTARSEID